MSLQLYIAGVDKSSSVVWPSLQWQQVLNNEVDTVSFQLNRFSGRSFAPAMMDEVKLYDGGTLVFGGHIVDIQKDFSGVDFETQTLTVKDYSHKMDARLVVETYSAVPAINVICDILNKYVNKDSRVEIATFDVNEVWSSGTADTTNHRIGTQGRKLTSASGATATMSRALYLDLTQNGLGTSDYIDVDVYVDTAANLSSCILKLGALDLSNYFYKDVTSQITADGWNLVHVLKSAFSSSGSPTWDGIYTLQPEVVSVGTSTVNVTFSNMQCVSATAYTRNGAALATQTVQYLKFNYEQPSKCVQQIADMFQWQWYVDELKDVHLFAIYGEAAAYNLTDTAANYNYKSLKISQNVDQLRNSIFVRGGEYLDTSVTEDLRHQIDGNNKVFKLGYKYADPIVTLQAVEKAVGTDNKDIIGDNQGASQPVKGTADRALGDNAARTYQSQQIITLKKSRLSKFKLRIKKVGTPADNFTVQIFSDDGSNKPSVTNLSTAATLAGGSITTSYAEYTFTLTEAVAGNLLFAKNGLFHVKLSRSGAIDASNYYKIDTGAAAYDGKAYTGTAAPVWTEQTNKIYFLSVVTYEVLYDLDRVLTFGTAPAAGNTLTVAGQPYKPVFVQYKDNASITAFGEYQSKIVDKTILTKEGARQRALQEILAWSLQVSEGSFQTYVSGLRVGQTINVQSDIRSISTDFLISRITATARTPASFVYEIELLTTKTFGIMYWLQQQILKDDKTLTIDDTEVLDKLEDFSESFTFLDAAPSTTLFTGHRWQADGGGTSDGLVWQGADSIMYWA